jgi:Icc-related predicted phosphoesterase
MKLAWATDIHLYHASEAARRRFCKSVNEQADALVVTGDIAEGRYCGLLVSGIRICGGWMGIECAFSAW